jgi:hypothetical protein
MSIEAMKLTDPHDHPEPHTMKWTQAEMDYINNRVEIAVRQAIEQAQKPEGYQEPVAYPEGDVVGPCICGSWPGGKCLKCPRIAPPPVTESHKRPAAVGEDIRKPLTDEQILAAALGHYNPYQRAEISFARAIEAAHGITGEQK